MYVNFAALDVVCGLFKSQGMKQYVRGTFGMKRRVEACNEAKCCLMRHPRPQLSLKVAYKVTTTSCVH